MQSQETRLLVENTPLEGVQLMTPILHRDSRGSFCEVFREEWCREKGMEGQWPQANVVQSRRNVVRGMHFQKEPGQAKLVQCLQGLIWDCLVDLRPGSPTWGKWWGTLLSAESLQILYIPRGLAHGYCVLSEDSLVGYRVSAYFNAQQECSLAWDDPGVGILWPLMESPILSDRDRKAPTLSRLVQEGLVLASV